MGGDASDAVIRRRVLEGVVPSAMFSETTGLRVDEAGDFGERA